MDTSPLPPALLMSCLPHEWGAACCSCKMLTTSPHSAAANPQSLPPFAPSGSSSCVTHQCKVSSQRNLKNAAVRDFVHHHDGNDDEAVAVVCCNAELLPRCHLQLYLLLLQLPVGVRVGVWASSSACACCVCCHGHKMPVAGQSCQTCFICGGSIIAAMSMSTATTATASATMAMAMAAAQFAYFTALFAVLVFAVACLFSFCWNFIIENVSMDVGCWMRNLLTWRRSLMQLFLI